ncbi:hypothetical protein B0T20DRAFT_469567 [Sordaria brevicollis]|uniref:Meiotically up-regulated gene 154 protein n=1 Tax=Sordaria brevicollis TaxID=83679 RepID=A0AAE0UCF4_SORBR|nr:hypothetical protein B0T20DRAFT_469567 [Sordaria brevicollis]
MPPAPRRLVRRRPLSERIQAFLNPADFYIWLSEEIQSFDWDSTSFGTWFGLIANFLFLLARANGNIGGGVVDDDVFSDAPSSGFAKALVNFLIWTLIPISGINAFYTMTRSRHYRLFEANVEAQGPSTPSAHRVRVDSSPSTPTPLRYIQAFAKGESAEARAHPDKTRDVWEIAVWDPYPATLRIFCLFSPGHALIYMLFLPLAALDPRPSVTVFKALVLQLLLTVQMLLLTSRFTQQSKDMNIIHREVMHEYDVKYVHPRVYPIYREVATQVSIVDDVLEEESVAIGTPSTIIRRGFETHPNPNYTKHFDPDGVLKQRELEKSMVDASTPARPYTPVTGRPSFGSITSSASVNRTPSLRQSTYGTPSSSLTARATPSKRNAGTTPYPGAIRAGGVGGGGNLGVYQHMNSPLRKSTSVGTDAPSPRNGREMAALEQRDLADRLIRQHSPVKPSPLKSEIYNRAAGSVSVSPKKPSTLSRDENGDVDVDGDGDSIMSGSAYMHSPATLNNARANRWTHERFPTRR